MTPLDVLAALCLALGVGVLILCCCGVLAMRGAADRLHYLSPATVLGVPLVGLAILLSHPGTQGGIKAVLIALALLAVGPVVTHATARAIHKRETEGHEE